MMLIWTSILLFCIPPISMCISNNVCHEQHTDTRGILQRRFTASNTLNVIYVTSNWLLYIYSVGTHRNMKGIVVKVQERTFCLTNYNMSSCDQIYVVSSVWSIYSFVVDLHSLKECNGRLVNRVVPIYSTDMLQVWPNMSTVHCALGSRSKFSHIQHCVVGDREIGLHP